ncbi:hypothetical protein [Prevotella fusca]|uniref:hypothetical protein n=1 Tax=Prevotella fusca TaxID=589436 RepID=UPI003FA04FCE
MKLSYHWVLATLLAVAAVGCSNDDMTTETPTKPETDKGGTAQATFLAGNEGTRTSLNYDNEDFYWEAGDKIFVKDDDNKFYGSSNAVTGTNVPSFKFMMPGKYSKNKYMVYYPGKDKTNDNVTIATTQTQNGADNTMHFGTSGDCGVGEATLEGGQYKFKLTHSAAYLCFKPSYDHPLETSYVTKVEVTADKDIAGNYTLGSDGKLTPKDGGSKTITLTPKETGSTEGFQLKNNLTKTSCETGRMFMVIAPGKYKLTVKYYIKDTQTGTMGTITKTFGSSTYEANGYYDMPAKLTMRAFDAKYYTWDAQKDYWFGHENDQPKENGTNNITTYPTSSDAQRWYNTALHPTRASNSAKDCPNANELEWYTMKGNPHWDNTTMWTVWGHIYTNGMWFKKAEVIAKENGKGSAAALKTVSSDEKNRVTDKIYETPPNNNKIKTGAPTNRNDYFFLPAMGYYTNGELVEFGATGLFWTSTPEPYNSDKNVAYNLHFRFNNVTVSNFQKRYNGLKLWTSE